MRELCFGDEIVTVILNQLLFHHDEPLRGQFLVLQSGTPVLDFWLVIETELDGAPRVVDPVRIPWYSLRSATTACKPSSRRTSLSKKQDCRRERLPGMGEMPGARGW